jgi:hypothetical protein
MVDKSLSGPVSFRNSEEFFLQGVSSVLTLHTPDVEEIAKAIWQRQHDTLDSGSLVSSRSLKKSLASGIAM